MAAITGERSARRSVRPATGAGEPPRWARLEAPAPGAVVAPTTAPTTPVRRRRQHQAVYRRRRLAAVAFLMLVAFAAGALLAVTLFSSAAAGSLTDEAREARQVTYVVEAGDTLWSVAETLAPGEDQRAVVDAISATRGTSVIRPGDRLVWPVG